jgi:hypothetical protein
MSFSRYLVATACLVAGLSCDAAQTIVMMRHAEKPPQGLGQLTCRGLNRALALPGVLLGRFGTPHAIFAPNPGIAKDDHGHTYNYIRPLATIEPTAIRAGLPVNTQWGFKDIGALENALLAPELAEAVVFVAWEHHLVRQAARDLLAKFGADPAAVPKWEDDDYDTLYVLTVTSDGAARRASFRAERQGLDRLPDGCPGQ